MIFQNFSPKQRQAMLWWAMPESKQYDAIVCDGSVRSGKTMAMSIGFLIWSMRNFDRESFAFCGKTIDSLKRNVIQPLQKWMEGIVQPKINLSKNYMDVQWLGHENRYYFFGGKDESSYTLIQGITLAGVLLDEAALMPQSFVDQAVARCSVTDSRLWFNCNPDGSEEHWFFQNWVGGEAASGKNRLHLHFTMEDNYALSDAVRQRYERMYTGVFYERYILGLWRMAEGLVYPMFDRSRHVVPDCMPPAGTGTFWQQDCGSTIMMDGNKIPERMKSITQRWSSWSERSIHLCGQSSLTRPLLLLWNVFGGTENSGFTRQIILFWTVSGMLARCLL